MIEMKFAKLIFKDVPHLFAKLERKKSKSKSRSREQNPFSSYVTRNIVLLKQIHENLYKSQ